MHFSLTDLAADITQNSAESGADLVELEIWEQQLPAAGRDPAAMDGSSPAEGEFRFITRDNGRGMDDAELKRAMDPFVTDGIKHPGRKVGLGIPFLIQTATQSGGGWKISSVKRGMEKSADKPSGTEVEAWFDLANVDTPPVGDIPGLFRTVLLFEGPREVVLRRKRQGGGGDLDYAVKKTELADVLGGLEDVSSLALLGRYLRSLEGEDG
ncbi:MAG: ATP-binding protein [Spirochaetaceae bacterium]|jgi:hypothetical protein|nr:ATP-binding protein [Spirochaetaceae bacterium]